MSVGTRHVSIGPESTYGTAVAPPHPVRLRSETFQLDIQRQVKRTLDSATPVGSSILRKTVRGGFIAEGNYQDLGFLFHQMYGAVTTSGAGPYTHTYPGSSGLAATLREGISSTVEVARGSQTSTWRYAGCKLTRLALTGGREQAPEIQADFIGKSEATGTWVASPSYPDADWINPPHGSTVSFDNGSSSFDCESFNLEWAWPVDEPHAVGSTDFAREPCDGDFSFSGSITIMHDDAHVADEYTAFLNQSAEDLQFILTDGTHSITVNANALDIVSYVTNVEGRERLMSVISFEGIKDTTATEHCQVVVVNDDSDVTD